MHAKMLEWPAGRHACKYDLKALESLQDATGWGVEMLHARLSNGLQTSGDMVAILKFGLVGGGMTVPDADRLVENAFERYGLAMFKPACLILLNRILYENEDDPVGEIKPGHPAPGGEKTESGASAHFTK